MRSSAFSDVGTGVPACSSARRTTHSTGTEACRYSIATPFRRALFSAVIFVCTTQIYSADLHVRGLGWFNNRTAEQKLKLLRGDQKGAPLDANALEDAALVLISALSEQGYLEPVLTIETKSPDGHDVPYKLDARLEPALPRPLSVSAATLNFAKSRRFTLREITFTGLQAIKPREARAFFVGENTLIPLASERIYSPGRLQNAVGNLEEALRQLGYAEVEATPDAPQIDQTTGDVRIRIAVQEGRRWVVNALQFEIADGSAAPAELVGERIGKPWTSLWRQDTATAIRRWYYKRGRPDVEIKLTAQTALAVDGTKSVTVVAHITPGPEVRVGQVRFTGNTRTREAMLRRLVPGEPNALLDPVKFNNSQARISRLGVFRTVDLRYDPTDAATRDVVYDLSEGRRQEINLLAGYGSYEQLRGGVEWRHYNLFGLAHTDSLKLIQSMKGSSGDYTYTVPALFGTFTDGSARLFGMRREEFSFINKEYGANVSVLWPLRKLKLAVTTGYTFKHLSNTDIALANSTPTENPTNVASLDLGLVHDRRDNPLQPRKGYKLALQAELANRALGGEVVYQQFVFSGSYHTGWGKGRWFHAGYSQGLVTTLGAANDNGLPVSVRFYPGGDGSIRGYQKGEAAPRNAAGLFVGAKSYMQGNLELEQSLTTKWSVVAFGDALGTAASLKDYPFNEKLFSVGLGVRYQTIIGPVRVEYGHNLKRRPLDPAGTLLISIGFPF